MPFNISNGLSYFHFWLMCRRKKILRIFVFDFCIGCSNDLPSVMSKNGNCKKLKLACSKLKKKCNSKLGAALGKSKSAKKCKKALKKNSNKKVDEFCTKTCKTCSKLIVLYFQRNLTSYFFLKMFFIHSSNLNDMF